MNGDKDLLLATESINLMKSKDFFKYKSINNLSGLLLSPTFTSSYP